MVYSSKNKDKKSKQYMRAKTMETIIHRIMNT